MSGLFDRWWKEMKTTFITCRRGQDTSFCLCHVRLRLLVLAPVIRVPGAASNALVSSCWYHNDFEAFDWWSIPLNLCRSIACAWRDNIVSLCCCSIIACPGAILVRFHFTDEPERLLTGSLTDWLSSDERVANDAICFPSKCNEILLSSLSPADWCASCCHISSWCLACYYLYYFTEHLWWRTNDVLTTTLLLLA